MMFRVLGHRKNRGPELNQCTGNENAKMKMTPQINIPARHLALLDRK
jgi:hypothetical protein